MHIKLLDLVKEESQSNIENEIKKLKAQRSKMHIGGDWDYRKEKLDLERQISDLERKLNKNNINS